MRIPIELPTLTDFMAGDYTETNVEFIRKTISDSFEFGYTICYIGPKTDGLIVTKTNVAKYYNAISAIVQFKDAFKKKEETK